MTVVRWRKALTASHVVLRSSDARLPPHYIEVRLILRHDKVWFMFKLPIVFSQSMYKPGVFLPGTRSISIRIGGAHAQTSVWTPEPNTRTTSHIWPMFPSRNSINMYICANNSSRTPPPYISSAASDKSTSSRVAYTIIVDKTLTLEVLQVHTLTVKSYTHINIITIRLVQLSTYAYISTS